MEETVSSLYGPGAIICWLCTAFSVLLSWCFNHSSRKYDVFTSDVVACLLLPAIAITQLVFELSHTKKTEDWKATPLMDATFTICMDFMPLGLVLCSLALYHRHIRRLVLTTLVTVASSATVLVFAANHTNVPHFDEQNALMASLIRGCTALLLIALLFQEERVNVSKCRRSMTCVLGLTGVLSMLQCLGFGMYFCGDDNCGKAGDKNNNTRRVEFRFLPRTPYSIGDIDQAVAMGIGIVTLLLSIRDVIQDYNFSVQEEFEYWRYRCVQNIEFGDTNVEVARWKQELDSIDKKAKCARTRARHRERELETYENLPMDVRNALEDYKIARALAACGIL